jgi:hypothetical protein
MWGGPDRVGVRDRITFVQSCARERMLAGGIADHR